jgi:oligopeptide/dipeptide ABC transporter ATP-binding protein
MKAPLLEVVGLKTVFETEEGVLPAVDGVSFILEKGKTLGIVGESGSGKSVTGLSILRLIPTPPGKILNGEVRFLGKDLLKASDSEMRAIRGNKISMVFQDPMTSLNPVFTIGNQILESIELHGQLSKAESRNKAIEMLRIVGISNPETRLDQYPHHLSGGMRQRVMIAMALACDPQVLIADEPTTALDVTIQAQILDLLGELQSKLGMAMILITHDLGVVSEVSHDVAVMYAGQIVETGPTQSLFQNPQHPYTYGLLESLPDLGQPRKRLKSIPGLVPNLANLPRGCRFKERCFRGQKSCEEAVPSMSRIDESSFRCLFPGDFEASS